MYQKLKESQGSLDLGTFKVLPSTLVHSSSVWLCTLLSIIYTCKWLTHRPYVRRTYDTLMSKTTDLSLTGLKEIDQGTQEGLGSHLCQECQVLCSRTSTEVGRSNLDFCNVVTPKAILTHGVLESSDKLNLANRHHFPHLPTVLWDLKQELGGGEGVGWIAIQGMPFHMLRLHFNCLCFIFFGESVSLLMKWPFPLTNMWEPINMLSKCSDVCQAKIVCNVKFEPMYNSVSTFL